MLEEPDDVECAAAAGGGGVDDVGRGEGLRHGVGTQFPREPPLRCDHVRNNKKTE